MEIDHVPSTGSGELAGTLEAWGLESLKVLFTYMPAVNAPCESSRLKLGISNGTFFL